jgi:hypothetical protein
MITKEQAFDLLAKRKVYYVTLSGGEFKSYAVVKSSNGNRIIIDEQTDKDLLTSIQQLDWSGEKLYE